MDDQLLREFLAEAEDLIEVLFGDIGRLRAHYTEGHRRRELVGRIFRHFHTIKGMAATAELEETSRIAHECESLLDGVRLGRVTVNDAVLDAFEDCAAAVSQTLSAAARGEAPPSPTLIERLRQLALKDHDRASPAATRGALDHLPAKIPDSLSEYEEHRLREALGEGARLFDITADFDLATFDESFRELSDALARNGEIISTLPGEEAAADQISFHILYVTGATPEELEARLSLFGVTKIDELTGEEPDRTESGGSETGGKATPEHTLRTTIAPFTTLARVELNELDELISTAHGLLRDTTSALELARPTNPARADDAVMESYAARIRRQFIELEERLISLRMVPVGRMLERAARAGRVAARITGKEIDFETAGGEVRLDKSLADAISDPLLHILRNAVDHGIESAAERTAAGKIARGRVRLEAITEGTRIRIRIADDGRGIDANRIARAAVERGIIDANTKITKEQSLRLIFRPGFSTATSVSSVSGRGVGLDVVESAVEQIGGELRVWSEEGAGTTFEMLLPTTLALMPALVVASGGYRYCIDAGQVARTDFIQVSEIERAGDQGLIRWRDEVLPLFHLRQLLAQPRGVDALGNGIHAVLFQTAAPQTGEIRRRVPDRALIAVDNLEGVHEVLVRGLGRHAARWRGVGGATELRDGTVALMLDLPRLLEMIP